MFLEYFIDVYNKILIMIFRLRLYVMVFKVYFNILVLSLLVFFLKCKLYEKYIIIRNYVIGV